MINSLGFDTIVIHRDRFYSDIDCAIESLYSFGIHNFLFIFDYDPLTDSVAILKSKLNEFKNFHTKASSRRVKIKCALNLNISAGIAFNDSISQLYASKNTKSLFVSLPLFTDDNYDPIALDINHLLYKKSVFLILSSFEKIVESSNLDFCSKFINNSRIGLDIDLNYLFNPQKDDFFKRLLNSRSMIFPSISKDFGNYAGLLESANLAIDNYGKKAYYGLCSQINKASTKIFI